MSANDSLARTSSAASDADSSAPTDAEVGDLSQSLTSGYSQSLTSHATSQFSQVSSQQTTLALSQGGLLQEPSRPTPSKVAAAMSPIRFRFRYKDRNYAAEAEPTWAGLSQLVIDTFLLMDITMLSPKLLFPELQDGWTFTWVEPQGEAVEVVNESGLQDALEHMKKPVFTLHAKPQAQPKLESKPQSRDDELERWAASASDGELERGTTTRP
jgi:hypothetical protein